jgi:hypothetical protein
MARKDRPYGWRIGNTDRSKRGYGRGIGKASGGDHKKGGCVVLLLLGGAMISGFSYGLSFII